LLLLCVYVTFVQGLQFPNAADMQSSVPQRRVQPLQKSSSSQASGVQPPPRAESLDEAD
jgi:hypothetical protein